MNQSELYCQIARARYQSQEGLNREFLTRASAIMTFGGALVGVAALVLNLGEATHGTTVIGMFAALLACFGGVALLCIWILKRWDWLNGPNLPALQGLVQGRQHTDEQMSEWVADVFEKAVKDNCLGLDCKARILMGAIVCLLAEAALLAGLALII